MTKGMILAAGQGTRVRPLTRDLPKPMVPILGKPVMEYLIEQMARHGVREIMVNVAYHHRKIEHYFGNGSRWGVEIGYSYEGVLEHGDIVPKPRGSAGGIRHIQDFSGFFDETTLVVCGDALVDLDIGAAVAEHKEKGAVASVVALDVEREQAVNRAIQSLALTRILIAHRPETILSAERVVVLTGGKVVDDLSTAELLARQAAAPAETAAEAG